MKPLFIFTLVLLSATTLSFSAYAAFGPEKPVDLIHNGAGKNAVNPSGLEKAKGIQQDIPLEISNVEILDTGTGSVTITWDTNRDASTIVTYWKLNNPDLWDFPKTIIDPNLTKSHEVVIHSIDPDFTYRYYLRSIDRFDNLADDTSAAFTFDITE